MKVGFRLYPNPLAAAGGVYLNNSTPQHCQAWCASNTTCEGAVFVEASAQCYSLPKVLSFYTTAAMDAWSKVPVQQTDGPPGGSWAPAGGFIKGVNATNCAYSTIKQLSIDYSPKPPSLFCFNSGTNPSSNVTCNGAEGPLGITLHFFNSTRMTAEDVTIHAAPYMAVTSFNGGGGHVLRRVSFERNEPNQLFVSERDGVHESDVRAGISILQVNPSCCPLRPHTTPFKEGKSIL